MDDRTSYIIQRAEHGGFMVGKPSWPIEFASTTLDEALRYIRQQLLPAEKVNQIFSDPDLDRRLHEYSVGFK